MKKKTKIVGLFLMITLQFYAIPGYGKDQESREDDVFDGCQDGPVKSILREAKKTDTIINFVDKERLDRLANSGHHQGVVAQAAAYEYAEGEDI